MILPFQQGLRRIQPQMRIFLIRAHPTDGLAIANRVEEPTAETNLRKKTDHEESLFEFQGKAGKSALSNRGRMLFSRTLPTV